MSDKEQHGAADGNVGGMPSSDVKFLVACLQNSTGGHITVDYQKVAEALGYTNPRSVTNKVAILKKKYDLPLGGTTGKGSGVPVKAPKTPGSSRKASSAAGPSEPAIPKTPTSKGKVTKSRNKPSTKKKATPKAKKAKVKEDYDDDIEEQPSDAESYDGYADVFGKLVSGEESEGEGDDEKGEGDDEKGESQEA